MDVRDFGFWLREAERNEVNERIMTMSSIRFGVWADGKQFQQALADLQRRISAIDGRQSQEVADNWAGLRDLGRG